MLGDEDPINRLKNDASWVSRAADSMIEFTEVDEYTDDANLVSDIQPMVKFLMRILEEAHQRNATS